MRIGPALALHVLLMSAAMVRVADGQTAAPTDSSPRVVDRLPVAAYSPHSSDRAIAQETWDYVFWFPSGHRLLAQFQITDAGPGSRTGLVAGIVIFPDHHTELFKNSRARGEWRSTVTGDDLRLSLARHVFDIGPTRHHVRIGGRDDHFDIEAEPAARPVVFGPVAYAKGERYELTLMAPRLRARATVHLNGSTPLTLTDGWGVALHAMSTLPDQDQALSVLRVHTFDQPTQFSMLAFAPPRQRGPAQVGWMLALRDGQTTVTPLGRRQYEGFVTEKEAPGYTSPRALRVAGVAPQTLEATLALSLSARFDIISWINTGIGRFLARRLFHPIQYVFDVAYDWRGPGDAPAVRGTTGVAVLWILNQPKGAVWP